jgi:hypothetical protein
MATTKKPVDIGTKIVLDERERRKRLSIDENRALKKHRVRLKARRIETDWPIDARTGERAEMDHDDVMAPLPDDLKAPIGVVDERMQELRVAVAGHVSFSSTEIDENLAIRRRLDRKKEREDRASITGDRWTEDLVEARIEEAFKVLGRLAVGATGPREFGNAMPAPLRSMADLVAQAGNKSLRNSMRRLFSDKGPPGGDEVRRMNESLAWAMQYLRDEDPDLAMFLNLGGLWRAWGAKVTRKCAEIGVHRQVFYRDRKMAVRKIVEGLIRDGRAP